MFKRNPPDYQATVHYNRASLSTALKLRIFNVIITTIASLYFITLFTLTTDWDMLLVSFVFMWLLYSLIKGYIQWQRILKAGTKIEREPNGTTKIEQN